MANRKMNLAAAANKGIKITVSKTRMVNPETSQGNLPDVIPLGTRRPWTKDWFLLIQVIVIHNTVVPVGLSRGLGGRTVNRWNVVMKGQCAVIG